MIDTCRLWLTDYTIQPNAELTVQPSAYVVGSGEAIAERVLWRDSAERVVSGAKAYLNTPRFNLTLAPPDMKTGDLFGPAPSLAMLSFSMPKVYGGGSNFAPVSKVQAAEVIAKVQDELHEHGVFTELKEAVLSRLDLFKNVETREPFACYAPLFEAMEAKRLHKRDYGTTYLWHNTQREYCVYDKRQELAQAGVSTKSLPDNVIRFEWRLLKGAKLRQALGMNSVSDMLSRYGELNARYRSGMTEELFRYQPAAVEAWSGVELEADMRYFMEQYGRNWLDRYLEAVGASWLVERADIKTVCEVVKRVTGDRQKSSRLAKKLQQYKLDLTLRREAPPVTLRSLYDELKRKLTAA